MMAYNHEKYIAQALDGVLMQNVNFDYDIVIGEDCSTDNTRSILLSYKEKHPDKIKLLLHEKNIGAVKNQIEVFKNCTGKYIAICEGDDYWTDPYKLQKQVDFLEGNEEYSMCFHNCQIKNDNVLFLAPPPPKSNICLKDFVKEEIYISTATVFFRNILSEVIPEHLESLYTGSYFIFMRLAEKGMLKYLEEPMSVYRVHDGGIWSGKTMFEKGEMALKNKEAMVIYFKNKPKFYKSLKKLFIRTSLFYSLYFAIHLELWKALHFIKKSFLFGFSLDHLSYWFLFLFQHFQNSLKMFFKSKIRRTK